MGALCASVQQPLCRHVNSTGPVSGAHIPMLMAAPGSWHQWLVTLCHQKNSLKSSLVDDYPLVNIEKAIENGHWNSWFTHKRRWFSVVFCMFTRPGILRDLIARMGWKGIDLIRDISEIIEGLLRLWLKKAYGWWWNGYGSIPIDTITIVGYSHPFTSYDLGFTRYQGFDPSPNGEFVRGLSSHWNFLPL